MAKDNENKHNAPTIAGIMQVLDRLGERFDRLAAEREVDRAEAKARIAAIDQQLEASGQQLREVGKQIGYIGNQWGKVAEYLLMSDLGRIIKARFGIVVDRCQANTWGNYQGKRWEIDALATNREFAVVVEIKVTLTKEDVDKFVATNLHNFPLYAPEHSHKKIHGLISFVKTNYDMEQELVDYVHSQGLLLVKMIDDTFRLLTPAGHQLHNYSIK